MKIKCPRCGQKMKYGTHACPKCGCYGLERMPKPKMNGFLKFLIVMAIIVASLALMWFAVGNVFTLNFHANSVVSTLNNGSLDLPGSHHDDLDRLPNYVQEMLGEDPGAEPDGPVVKAILPYLRAEKRAVHGLFGGTTVEYNIAAPDVESWILELDPAAITSSEQLLNDLIAYLPTAPMRRVTVEIEYYRDGLFGWEGNYNTREFADAVCGGMNEAYNTLYMQILDELEAAIQ